MWRWWEGEEGGHALERMKSPPKKKKDQKKPLVEEEKEEDEGERGGGVAVLVYDLQGEPKMFHLLCVCVCGFQIPESPVPSRGMLMTSVSMKSC